MNGLRFYSYHADDSLGHFTPFKFHDSLQRQSFSILESNNFQQFQYQFEMESLQSVASVAQVSFADASVTTFISCFLFALKVLNLVPHKCDTLDYH